MKKIHNGYDYSLFKYKNSKKKVDIICPKHGKFKQLVSSHLSGQGCPKCNFSKGEVKISNILNEKNIPYIYQYKVDDINKIYDFYLPDYEIFIEYDGIQHFKVIDHFGGVDGYRRRKISDTLKDNFCKEQGYILIRIPYYEYDNIEYILHEKINEAYDK